MKEIWINLELYIKSYEFSIFRDFFRSPDQHQTHVLIKGAF